MSRGLVISHPDIKVVGENIIHLEPTNPPKFKKVQDAESDMDKKVDKPLSSHSEKQSESDITFSDVDSYGDAEYKLPESTLDSDTSASYAHKSDGGSPMSNEKVLTNKEDVHEHLQHPVVADREDEDIVEATVSQTPAVEAAINDEMEIDQKTNSSGSYDGYDKMADLTEILDPVEKPHRQLFKFRKAQKEKTNLKKCLPAHFYTRKNLTRNQILNLARTFKNPYSLATSFSEPSQRGVYVYSAEEKAQRGSDRKLISNLDVYTWKNKGKWVMRFKPRKYPNDAVVKMSWFARIKNDDDTRKWTKTAYWIASSRRYIVHYQGDPKFGTKIGDWKVEEDGDDSEHESDVIPTGKKGKSLTKETESVIATQLQKSQHSQKSLKSMQDIYDLEFVKATPVEVLHPVEPLSIEEVREKMNKYHDTPSEQKSSGFVITNPQAGEFYALNICDLKAVHNVSDWRRHTLRDTYSWKQHYQSYKYDMESKVERVYYTCNQAGNAFRRYVYYDMYSGKVYVHYMGDEAKAVRQPHGNSNPSVTAPFISSSNVVMQKIRKLKDMLPTEAFNQTLAKAGAGLVRSLTVPRNVSSVKYLQRDHKESMKLASDDLVAAMYVSESIVSFTRQIWAWPHRNAVMISEPSLENFKEVLKNIDPEIPVVFGYDTTFKYGEFFVSTLNYRHPLMKNVKEGTGHTNHEPIIPLAFFIHERRHATDHKQAFAHMQAVLQTATQDITPSFDTVPKIFCADREFKNTFWENTKILYCWKHIQDNCDRKLKDLGFDRTQRQAFQKDFLEALHSSSESSYDDRITAFNNGTKSEAWTHAKFMEYYNRHIDPSVKESSGKWVLEEYRLPNAHKGTYNNASESINATIAKIRGKNKKTMDQAIIDFKYYIDIYDYKVLSAFHGHEPYQLKERYLHLARNPDDLPAALIVTPCERLASIQNYWNVWEKDFSREPTIKDVKRDYVHHTIQREAEYLWKMGKVEHIKSQRYWSVLPQDNKPLRVTLEPLTCDCGSKTICAHVLAVKYDAGAINEFVIPTKTKNRQNMGERKSKITGTKAHHKFETEHKGVDLPKKPRTMRDIEGAETDYTHASDDSESTGKETTALFFTSKVTASAKKPKRTSVATPKTPRAPAKTSAPTPKPSLKKTAETTETQAITPVTPATGIKRTVTFDKKDRMSGPDFKRAKMDLFRDDEDDLKMNPRDAPHHRFLKTDKSLKEAGYYVRDFKELRQFKKGKETREKFKFNKFRPEEYEHTAELLNDWVQGRLESHLKFQRVTLSDATFVFASKGYQEKEKLAILIHGSGKVRAGLWSRREAVNNGLDKGSQLPYIQELEERDFGVICLNTNQIVPEFDDPRPIQHAVTAWFELIDLHTKAESIVVVAHSFGGYVAHHLANEFLDDFTNRVTRIFLADSAHSNKQKLSEQTKEYLKNHATNYVTSKLKVGRDVASDDFVQKKSAGTSNHDLTPVSAFNEIMNEIDSIKKLSPVPITETESKAIEPQHTWSYSPNSPTNKITKEMDSHEKYSPGTTIAGIEPLKSPVQSFTKDSVSSIEKSPTDKITKEIDSLEKSSPAASAEIERTKSKSPVESLTKDSVSSIKKAMARTNSPFDALKLQGYILESKNYTLQIYKDGKESNDPVVFKEGADDPKYKVVSQLVNECSQILLTDWWNYHEIKLANKSSVLASKDFETKDYLAVLISECGDANPGLWSKELAVKMGLLVGSQIPMAEGLMSKGCGVVSFNTNNETNCNVAWREVIENSSAYGIFIIGHRSGGNTALNLARKNLDFFELRVKGIFMIDTDYNPEEVYTDQEKNYLTKYATNYVSSEKELGAMVDLNGVISSQHSGTYDPKLATYSAVHAITEEIGNRVFNLADTVKTTLTEAATTKEDETGVTAKDTTRRTSTRAPKPTKVKVEEEKRKTVEEEKKKEKKSRKKLKEDEKASKALTLVKDTETSSTEIVPSVERIASVEIVDFNIIGSSKDTNFIRFHNLQKLDLENFEPNTMSIFKGQYKSFNDIDGAQMSIYCRENGKAVAFYDHIRGKDQSEQELIKFAAAVVSAGVEASYDVYTQQLDAKVCLKKAGDEDTTDEICKELQTHIEGLQLIIEKENSLRTKITDQTKLPEFDYPASEQLVCHERLPCAVRGSNSELVTCIGCAEAFHAECVSSELEKDSFNLTCISCSVPYNGVQWGNGKYTDSCPVDNIVTYVALQESIYGNVIQKLPQTTPGEALFKNCVSEAIKGNDSYVHDKLYNYLLKLEHTPLSRKASLWGNPHDMIFTPLLKDCFVREASCTPDCFRNGEPVEAGLYMMLNDDYGKAIRDFERETLSPTVCDQCTMVVTNSPVKIAAGREPYILSFCFDGCIVPAREALENIPESLNIGKDTFKLGMITINQPRRNHFMGLIKHESGKWLAYDGLFNHNGLKTNHKKDRDQQTSHFRIPFTSDWNTPFSKVSSIDYFRE